MRRSGPERGSTLFEVLVAVMVGALAIAGAMGAQWFALHADRDALHHTRAALILDATLELMRAGYSQTVAEEIAHREAFRHLPDGNAKFSGDAVGANVLTVWWHEPNPGLAYWSASDCSKYASLRAGQSVRCVSVGFLR
jgi:Tfp pilus assembly protein PilV